MIIEELVNYGLSIARRNDINDVDLILYKKLIRGRENMTIILHDLRSGKERIERLRNIPKLNDAYAVKFGKVAS